MLLHDGGEHRGGEFEEFGIEAAQQGQGLFHHVSTDEVYGSLGPEGYGIEAVVKDLMTIPTRGDLVAAFSVGGEEFRARLPAVGAPEIGRVERLRFDRLHLFDPVTGSRIDTIEGSVAA